MKPDWANHVIATENIPPVAARYNVDPNLMIAMCYHESRFDPFACRYEPNWRYYLTPHDYASKLGITQQTETFLQACSWGVSQIMGSVAREMGLQASILTLTEPQICLEFMGRKMRDLFVRYGNEDDVVAAYNQGGIQKTPGGQYLNMTSYHDPVFALVRQLRTLQN